MLIAPIFHNSYLSPKHSESQSKQNDAASSSSASTKRSDASGSAKYNNIFKTAFNRGITFLSKIAANSSSGSNTPTTSTSADSKPEANRDSSTSETPSDCSSPDSLKTEMIFFKPISREPKTPSSSKPVLLRVPSIRSTASSTDRHINSPCPSPFFIPITPRRQSAFSFVSHAEESDGRSIVKPKATKRKRSKASPVKSPKRVKREAPVVKAKAAAKTETVKRKTRSMETKEEFLTPAKSISKQKDFKTLPKAAAKKEVARKQPAVHQRVTRSQSLKH